jgi:riboflavin biosynthesis pyrimidine reductase
MASRSKLWRHSRGCGALNARRLNEAVEYAQQTHRLGVRRLKRASLDSEPHLATALGASIEVLAQAMEKRGLHDEAVRFLNRQFAKLGTTPIKTRIRKTLNVLTMEGQPAPELEIRQWLGPKPHLRTTLGVHLLLHKGGPTLFGQFVAAGLIDEFFLTLAPQIAGRIVERPRPAMISGTEFFPDTAPWLKPPA